MVGGRHEIILKFEFHRNRSSGLGAVRVKIFPFSLIWPLTYTKS